jgi:hypothetical protein
VFLYLLPRFKQELYKFAPKLTVLRNVNRCYWTRIRSRVRQTARIGWNQLHDPSGYASPIHISTFVIYMSYTVLTYIYTELWIGIIYSLTVITFSMWWLKEDSIWIKISEIICKKSASEETLKIISRAIHIERYN